MVLQKSPLVLKGDRMKRNAVCLLIIFMSLIFSAPFASSEPGHWTGSVGGGYREEGPSARPPERPPMGPSDGEWWPGRPGPEPSWWSHLPALNLDERQMEALKGIERRRWKDEIRKGAELEVNRIELQELLDKDPLDLKAVEAKLKKMETLMTEIQLASIKAGEQIKALLTPPQKEALKNFHRLGPRGEDLLPGRRRMLPPGEEEEEGRPGGQPKTPRK
jgi:Spy/CpxP family protein refolding chaperone